MKEKRIFKKKFKITSCHKFSKTTIEEAPKLFLRESLDDWLYRQYSGAGSYNHNLLHHGIHKTCGWLFRFNLNRYVYKSYGSWYEAYAPNKKLLRRCICGNISEIIQIG